MNIPTFHLQGFDTPPHGVIDMLRGLSWPNDTSVYILDPLNGLKLSVDQIAQDQSLWKFVIINTHEGASHHWFDRLLPELHHRAKVPWDHIAIRSSCLWNPESPVAHIGSIVDYVTDTVAEYPDIIDAPSDIPTHRYVCLNNMHRWQRLALVESLIDRNILEFGKVSYLQAPAQEVSQKNQRLFPLVLDDAMISWSQGHRIDYPALANAMFNVVTESCYESQPGISKFETHHLPGLTEKTYKSILLAQIPIFLAPRYTVKCYRELGFDPFDDVVDHSYDEESDPVKRIGLVADQIQRICKLDLEDIQNLKVQNAPRFQANLDRFRWYSGNHLADLPKWQKWLESI